jgi:DNA-binding CsgD family transcriptional regulator
VSPNPLERDVKAAGLVDQLSPRQQEILALIASGLSNRDIGSQLSLTTGTVKQHLNGIFAKIGVSNRTSAAALWRDSQVQEGDPQALEPLAPGLSSLAISPTPGRPLAIAIIGLVLTGDLAIEPSSPPLRRPRVRGEAICSGRQRESGSVALGSDPLG